MILRPDEYAHNNSSYAIVDSENVRGGRLVVLDLPALFALSNAPDKLKENVTVVYVQSEDKDYVLRSLASASSISGWEVQSAESPPEVAIQTDEPTGTEKLWVSGIPGVPGQPSQVDWNNITNKPGFTNWFSEPLTPGYMVRVNNTGTGYEYFDQVSSSWENIENKPNFTNWFSEPLTPGYFVKAKADGTGYEYVELILDWNTIQSKPSWTYAFPDDALQPGAIIKTKNDGIGFEYTTIKSDEISYDNPMYPSVKAALDKLLYISPSVSLTGGLVNEVGSMLTYVNLYWNVNKPMQSISINNGVGDVNVNDTSYTHSGLMMTTDTTYTITANDGVNNADSSTSFLFRYKRYWGTSLYPSLPDSEIFIFSKELSSSRIQNRTFDCSGGKYFYIVYPSSFGLATFKVGGLSFSDMNLEVRTITNESGAPVELNIYRVNNLQTGSAINVEVL